MTVDCEGNDAPNAAVVEGARGAFDDDATADDAGAEADTFACPAGIVRLWVAAAVQEPGNEQTLTVGGASGLGIEVIGMPDGW